jgi:hypothetical protein
MEILAQSKPNTDVLRAFKVYLFSVLLKLSLPTRKNTYTYFISLTSPPKFQAHEPIEWWKERSKSSFLF